MGKPITATEQCQQFFNEIQRGITKGNKLLASGKLALQRYRNLTWQPEKPEQIKKQLDDLTNLLERVGKFCATNQTTDTPPFRKLKSAINSAKLAIVALQDLLAARYQHEAEDIRRHTFPELVELHKQNRVELFKQSFKYIKDAYETSLLDPHLYSELQLEKKFLEIKDQYESLTLKDPDESHLLVKLRLARECLIPDEVYERYKRVIVQAKSEKKQTILFKACYEQGAHTTIFFATHKTDREFLKKIAKSYAQGIIVYNLLNDAARLEISSTSQDLCVDLLAIVKQLSKYDLSTAQAYFKQGIEFARKINHIVSEYEAFEAELLPKIEVRKAIKEHVQQVANENSSTAVIQAQLTNAVQAEILNNSQTENVALAVLLSNETNEQAALQVKKDVAVEKFQVIEPLVGEVVVIPPRPPLYPTESCLFPSWRLTRSLSRDAFDLFNPNALIANEDKKRTRNMK